MASKKDKKDEKANKVSTGKFKGVVAKKFKAGGVTYKPKDIFRTDSDKGLLNLINNGFIESSLEKERVDKLNKRILKWQQ